MTLSIMLSVITLSTVLLCCYAECRYAERRYADCYCTIPPTQFKTVVEICLFKSEASIIKLFVSVICNIINIVISTSLNNRLE